MDWICTVLIILLLFSVIFFYMSRSTASAFFPKNADNPAEIPEWLKKSLDKFAKEVLAYEIYRISLDEELSVSARQMLDSLEEKKYSRPTLVLYKERKASGCTDKQLQQYLVRYIQQETGKDPQGNTSVIYCVQQLIIERAKAKALGLQQKKGCKKSI